MIPRASEARRSRLVLAGLVLVHLVLISRQVEGGAGGSLLERIVLGVFSPIQSGVVWTGKSFRNAWDGYVALRGAERENRVLREQLRRAELLLQERSERAREAEQLREVLELRKALPLDTLTAEVVGRDGTPFYRTLTINKGKSDGVVLNAPVVSSTGVVGRVIRLGRHVAQVQLLLDRESGVGARIERTRITGVVSGQVGYSGSGGGELVMKYVPALGDVVPGDVVVTSGLDRMYPRGLMVGRVRSVGLGGGLFKEIYVVPSAGFDLLEVVMVVRQPAESESFEEAVR